MSFNAPINTENSQPVAADTKMFALLQLQRIGYKVGQIKITDFMRRDEDDEIAHKVKQDRGLREWLDAQRFQDFSDKLSAFIGDQTKAVDKTIDGINETINQLKALDGNDGALDPAITALRDARTGLKKQKTRLSEIDRRLGRARNIDDIQGIAVNTENTANNISQIRNNAQNVQSDVDLLLDLYDTPSADGGRSRAGGGGRNSSSQNNQQNSGQTLNANNQGNADTRIIKIGLLLLAQEKDDTKVTKGLNALIDRFTRPKVTNALGELKSNDQSSKFDRVSTNMDKIIANPPGAPEPQA